MHWKHQSFHLAFTKLTYHLCVSVERYKLMHTITQNLNSSYIFQCIGNKNLPNFYDLHFILSGSTTHHFLRKPMKKILVLFHKKEAISVEGHPCWQRHWQHQYEDIVLSKSDKSNPNKGLASLVMNILYIRALINNWDWGLDVFLCRNSSHSISQWQAHGLIIAEDIITLRTEQPLQPNKFYATPHSLLFQFAL